MHVATTQPFCCDASFVCAIYVGICTIESDGGLAALKLLAFAYKAFHQRVGWCGDVSLALQAKYVGKHISPTK